MRIRILKAYQGEFETRLAKIQRKLNIEVLSSTELVAEIPTEVVAQEMEAGNYISSRLVEIEYELASPLDNYRVEGFKWVGLLKMDDAGVKQLHSVKDFDLVGKVEDEFNFECFHCHKTMSNRNKRFFFLKEADNSLVSIGSTCAKDYFGFDICTTLERGLDYINQIEEMGEEYSRRGGRIRNSRYSEIVVRSIQLYHARRPYVSKSKADEASAKFINMASTAAIVSHYVYSHLDRDEQLELDKLISEANLTDLQVAEEVKKIEKYYAEFYPTPANTFEYNLKNQFEDQGSIVGILAYGVYNYYWKTTPKAPKAEYDYYPADDVKDLEVVCTKATGFETDWGMRSIFTFVKDQYQFVLFTSGSFTAKEGDVVMLKKAKIIEKSEYRGTKQNKIKATVRGLVNVTEEKDATPLSELTQVPALSN